MATILQSCIWQLTLVFLLLNLKVTNAITDCTIGCWGQALFLSGCYQDVDPTACVCQEYHLQQFYNCNQACIFRGEYDGETPVEDCPVIEGYAAQPLPVPPSDRPTSPAVTNHLPAGAKGTAQPSDQESCTDESTSASSRAARASSTVAHMPPIIGVPEAAGADSIESNKRDHVEAGPGLESEQTPNKAEGHYIPSLVRMCEGQDLTKCYAPQGPVDLGEAKRDLEADSGQTMTPTIPWAPTTLATYGTPGSLTPTGPPTQTKKRHASVCPSEALQPSDLPSTYNEGDKRYCGIIFSGQTPLFDLLSCCTAPVQVHDGCFQYCKTDVRLHAAFAGCVGQNVQDYPLSQCNFNDVVGSGGKGEAPPRGLRRAFAVLGSVAALFTA